MKKSSVLSSLSNWIGEKIRELIRVIKIAKKPEKKEVIQSAKISLIGILIVGLIGFIIQIFFYLFSR